MELGIMMTMMKPFSKEKQEKKNSLYIKKKKKILE